MVVVKVSRRFVVAVVFCALSILASRAEVQADTQYFDTNGATAGSGVTAAGTYSWENAVWNDVNPTNDPVNGPPAANGTLATGNWTDGNFPRFAAGVDAAGLTYTVTASSPHTIAGMQLLIGASYAANGANPAGPNVNGGATVNVNA